MKPPSIGALILAKNKPDKSAESAIEGGDESAGSELDMAASDMIDAIKSGDAAGLTAALQSFMTMSENASEPSESSDSEVGGE